MISWGANRRDHKSTASPRASAGDFFSATVEKTGVREVLFSALAEINARAQTRYAEPRFHTASLQRGNFHFERTIRASVSTGLSFRFFLLPWTAVYAAPSKWPR